MQADNQLPVSLHPIILHPIPPPPSVGSYGRPQLLLWVMQCMMGAWVVLCGMCVDMYMCLYYNTIHVVYVCTRIVQLCHLLLKLGL